MLATTAAAASASATDLPHRIGDLDRQAAGEAVENLVGVGNLGFFAGRDHVHGRELWRSDGTSKGTWLIADLRPGPSDSDPSRMFEVGTRAFFTADDGVHGRELWRSDGTRQGTRMVKDLLPGAGPGLGKLFDGDVLVVGEKIYFAADENEYGSGIGQGRELWRSDGTAAGTQPVADINPGPASSYPRLFGTLGTSVLFEATHPESGSELWITDGSAEGTRLLLDLTPGRTSSSWSPLGAIGHRFLLATSERINGLKIWTTDGTAAGTKTLRLSANRGFSRIGIWHDSLWFTATDNNFNSWLYRTDGTDEGTTKVAPRVGLAQFGIATIDDAFFFVANALPDHRQLGAQLWRSDGTAAGTVAIRDPIPTGCSGEFGTLLQLGERFVFAARELGHGWDMWASDGTSAGTIRLHEFAPRNARLSRPNRVAVDGNIIFTADDGRHGGELWRTDGTARGTVLIEDILHVTANALDSSNGIGALPNADGQIYFGDRQGVLWRSNGWASGTRPLPRPGPAPRPAPAGRFDPASRFARPLAVRADGTVFYWFGGASGTELWRSGGLAPLATFSDYWPSMEATFVGDLLVFVGANEPWRSDGTTAGTRQITALHPERGGSAPSSLITVGDHALFTTTDAANGQELWATDGTAAGTIRLSAIGGAGSSIELLQAGDIAFAILGNLTSSRVLLVTDGTVASTRLLKVFAPGPLHDSYDFAVLAASSPGELLVLVGEAQGGLQLWRSDGTAAGTAALAIVQAPGAPAEEARGSLIGRLGTGVLFNGFSPEHGLSLMRFDLTTSTLDWLADAKTDSGQRAKAVEWQERLYFVADDAVHGPELWQSDGTAVGTALVADIFPGARGSELRNLTVADDKLFFFAADGRSGLEPWVIDPAGSSLEIQRVTIQQPARPGGDCALIEVAGRVSGAPSETLDSTIWIRDGNGLAATAQWASTGCAGGTRSALRCTSADGSDVLRLSRGRTNRIGETGFVATLGGSTLACTLRPPVKVSLAIGTFRGTSK